VPGALEILDDPEDAVEGADLVIALNWGSGDGADGSKEAVERHAAWRLTPDRLARAAPGALVGGGLPQSRGREIQASLLESRRSIHLDESVNLLHVAKAVLALTLDLSREL
jgi:ornithine carbamoyltransferase